MAATSTSGSGSPALALDDAAVERQGRRAAQVENTRRALLDVARQLFTENGYQATRTEEIVQRAGVTRGALYHHFRDKEDLFRSVLDEVDAEVESSLLRRSKEHAVSSWELFRVNSEIHLDAASRNPAYRQIVLIDGPSVLGGREWSERRGGPQVKISEYLIDAIEEGSIDALPIEPLAQILISIGVGSAMYIAEATEPELAHAQVAELTERLLGGLSKDAHLVSTKQQAPTTITTKKENH